MNGLSTISCVYSLFFSLFVIQSARSQENKYTKRNETAPVIQYSSEKCYSRSIQVIDSVVYTANSNGTLYATNLQTKQSFNILADRNYQELRDTYYYNSVLTAVQSGTNGKIAHTNRNKHLTDYTPDDGSWNSLFIDGVDVKDSTGFLMGDPQNGSIPLFVSSNGGRTWVAGPETLKSFEGEVGFAASGTNVQVLNDSTFVFVTGGKKSRFFRTNDAGHTWEFTSLPYMTGESCGAFSICMINEMEGVIVGGDYKNPDLHLNTCFFTDDGGKFWINSEVQTRGYRSCVVYKNGVLYTCGPNGIDYSTDKGEKWKPFANGTFLAMCTDEKTLYATIPNGKFKVFELIDRR